MKTPNHLLMQVLRRPETMAALRLADWDLLVRQARHANLLARLHVLAEEHSGLEPVPDQALRHLESARLLAGKQERSVRWEVHCIQRTLADTDIPFILLKGAAYVMAELPPAGGRLFSDVDIMVAKADLPAAEKALMMRGWVTTHYDAYDQRYYRKWMHEVPPLQHIRRQTVLDLHHAILPETARLHPDPEKLREAAISVDGKGNLKVLTPADMVLHSATHLFHDGELESGLRDLADLDSLFRHFGQENDFWFELVERAKALELVRPLYYALRYTHRILDTPVPEEARQAAQVGRPGALVARVMDFFFLRGLAPNHPSCDVPFSGFARWVLYVRAHYLRMPLHLLVPHLIHKALKRPKES